MIIRFLFLIFCFFSTGCSLFNHYAMREGNTPVDGNKVSSKTYNNEDVIFYPKGNLDYVINEKDVNKKTYFASAKLYNDTQYDLTNDYLGRYMNQIKVNTDELEKEIQNEGLNTKGKNLLEQMEYGNIQTHPVSGNIKIMQWLKDNKDKIAYPEYIAEYLDIYTEKKQKQVIKNADFEDIVVDQTKSLSADNIRDYYVNYYLAFDDGYTDILHKQVEFKERPLV